ncbi:MAG TPA: DUF4383 domain-containing protein [Opitutaceae bacterium]|nr:DUF4383 domain-containing protein [Opitutaceae bacterium]
MVPTHVPRQFALIVSAFLLVEGIWELFSPVVFGAFSSNQVHGVIHIVLGIGGLVAAARGAARGFLTFLGVVLLAVGILWFVPATRHIPEDVINVNRAVAIFNVILGAVSLFMARDARRHARL